MTKEWKTGYKVVRVKNKKLESFVVGINRKGQGYQGRGGALFPATRYSTTKIAVPRKDCGPLAVFSTLKKAQSFFTMHGDPGITNQIYECQYVESTEKRLYIPGHTASGDFPNGTCFASQVILTKRISTKI